MNKSETSEKLKTPAKKKFLQIEINDEQYKDNVLLKKKLAVLEKTERIENKRKQIPKTPVLNSQQEPKASEQKQNNPQEEKKVDKNIEIKADQDSSSELEGDSDEIEYEESSSSVQEEQQEQQKVESKEGMSKEGVVEKQIEQKEDEEVKIKNDNHEDEELEEEIEGYGRANQEREREKKEEGAEEEGDDEEEEEMVDDKTDDVMKLNTKEIEQQIKEYQQYEQYKKLLAEQQEREKKDADKRNYIESDYSEIDNYYDNSDEGQLDYDDFYYEGYTNIKRIKFFVKQSIVETGLPLDSKPSEQKQKVKISKNSKKGNLKTFKHIKIDVETKIPPMNQQEEENMDGGSRIDNGFAFGLTPKTRKFGNFKKRLDKDFKEVIDEDEGSGEKEVVKKPRIIKKKKTGITPYEIYHNKQSLKSVQKRHKKIQKAKRRKLLCKAALMMCFGLIAEISFFFYHKTMDYDIREAIRECHWAITIFISLCYTAALLCCLVGSTDLDTYAIIRWVLICFIVFRLLFVGFLFFCYKMDLLLLIMQICVDQTLRRVINTFTKIDVEVVNEIAS